MTKREQRNKRSRKETRIGKIEREQVGDFVNTLKQTGQYSGIVCLCDVTSPYALMVFPP